MLPTLQGRTDLSFPMVQAACQRRVMVVAAREGGKRGRSARWRDAIS
jgi:hypothetical protein